MFEKIFVGLIIVGAVGLCAMVCYANLWLARGGRV